MKSAARSAWSLLFAAALVLCALPAVLAHGDEHAAAGADMEMDMDMDMSAEDSSKPDAGSYAPTYFTHPEHRGLIYAHIGLMVLSWVVILPLGKERYTIRATADPGASVD